MVSKLWFSKYSLIASLIMYFLGNPSFFLIASIFSKYSSFIFTLVIVPLSLIVSPSICMYFIVYKCMGGCLYFFQKFLKNFLIRCSQKILANESARKHQKRVGREWRIVCIDYRKIKKIRSAMSRTD